MHVNTENAGDRLIHIHMHKSPEGYMQEINYRQQLSRDGECWNYRKWKLDLAWHHSRLDWWQDFWMYKGSFHSSFVEVPLSIYHDSLILINPVVIFSVMLCHTWLLHLPLTQFLWCLICKPDFQDSSRFPNVWSVAVQARDLMDHTLGVMGVSILSGVACNSTYLLHNFCVCIDVHLLRSLH